MNEILIKLMEQEIGLSNDVAVRFACNGTVAS